MDELIISLRNLANDLMPILGAGVLICLIILLIRLIKLMSSVDTTLNKTHTTIDLVDETIQKAQAPLDTVVKVSKSVDKAHDATIKAAGIAKDYIVDTAENIKDKVVALVNNQEDEANTDKLDV